MNIFLFNILIEVIFIKMNSIVIKFFLTSSFIFSLNAMFNLTLFGKDVRIKKLFFQMRFSITIFYLAFFRKFTQC